MRRCIVCTLGICALFVAAAPANGAEEWSFKNEFWPELVRAVPDILRSQDEKTGRFGRGIWIVTDQNVMLPLAAVWALEHPGNRYHHSDDVLKAIMAGGDALIDDQDERGMWEFRKKDGSTWGMIYMPWIYSRWIRAFGLIRDAMPPGRRARWEKALTLGFEGISKTALGRVHNIPSHHAMALYHAGQVLDRPEWREQAKKFLAKVCAEQNPGGYWSEHMGPVVGYNFVYTDALGVYYAMSEDAAVLPALERAAAFHANFTYPDGSRLETIDERNPYHEGVSMGTVGFTFSAEGRRFLLEQWRQMRKAGEGLSADDAASFILYGKEGPLSPARQAQADYRFVLGQNDAMVQQHRPWFACLSAFHCPVPESRWIQDRQNLVSLFHDELGLIVGGGNTKLQPLWSTFAVGDVSLLFHRPGDTSPKFTPPKGLWHVPDSAELRPDQLRLDFRYGPQQCRVQVDTSDTEKAKLIYEIIEYGVEPVRANVTLMPHLGKSWQTASGRHAELGEEPFRLGPGEAGDWFAHHGWRISIPPEASVVWPAIPHNPYRKDGRATAGEGRIVIVLPFSQAVRRHELTVEAASVQAK